MKKSFQFFWTISFSSTENMSNEISIIAISFIKENKTIFISFLKKRPCHPSKKKKRRPCFFKIHFFLCYFLKHSVISYISRGTFYPWHIYDYFTSQAVYIRQCVHKFNKDWLPFWVHIGWPENRRSELIITNLINRWQRIIHWIHRVLESYLD